MDVALACSLAGAVPGCIGSVRLSQHFGFVVGPLAAAAVVVVVIGTGSVPLSVPVELGPPLEALAAWVEQHSQCYSYHRASAR